MIDSATLPQLFSALDAKNQSLISELILQLLPRNADITQSIDYSLFIQPWLDHLANSGKSRWTAHDYIYPVRNFLRQFPDPTPLSVDMYFTFLRPKVSLRTLQAHSSALRSFFTFCKGKGAPAMPLIESLPVVKVPFKRRNAPSPDDVAALLAYPKLKLRSRVLLYILIDSGPRLSEVLSLRRSDIDLARKSITLMGKGRKQRTIPISQPTADIIQEYLSSSTSNYLFPGRRLTWSTNSCQHHLKLLCRRAGVSAFTPHQLRHFFATQAINSGGNIRSISEVLGHKDPGVTLKVYCHTNDELNRREHAAHTPLSKLLKQEGSKCQDAGE